MTIPDSFTFDDTKIQSLDSDDKKELLLFQWLSRLEKDLVKHPISNQKHLEQLLLKYLSIRSPKPNQATRRLIARCFNVIYTKGDHRSFFDTVVAIHNMFLNKTIDDLAIKLAGIHCLGVITEEHGSKAMSLFVESVSIIQKFLRYAKDAEISLRYECIKALTSLLKGAGKGASDALSKGLFKIAKNGTYDKLPLIKRISFELMDAIYNFTVYIPPLSLSEYENMIVSIAKYVESGFKPLRNAAASTIATLLMKSQKPIPKQALKMDESPSEKPILSISDMLSLLPLCYLKSSTIEARITIVEGFAMFFRKCGLGFAESNYADISKICAELASHSKLQTSKHDLYVTKEIADFLLHDVIGKLLSETGQLNACRHLGQELKRSNISEIELNFIISELGALLSELGPAAYPIQDEIVEPLLLLISKKTSAIKLTLASCLRNLCLALPQNITRCMNRLVISIQRGLPTMSAERPETIYQVMSYGNILSAIVGIISSRPLFAAYEDAATIFGLATQLIKTHTNAKDYQVMSSQAQLGWTLVGSLMSLGPNFVKVHLSQLLLIWKNIFQKNQPKDAVVVRGELEWSYILNSKESALAALQGFILFNKREISNVDVAKRVFVCLSNTLQFLATLNGAYGPVDEKPPTPSQVALYEKECDLRRRLFECFKLLSPCSIYESIYTYLIRTSLDVFAMDPDKPDRFLATVGSRDGVFFAALGGKDSSQLIIESVSPTSLAHGAKINVAEDSGAEDKGILKHKITDGQSRALDDIIDKAPQKSLENDPHCLYLTSTQTVAESKNGVETTVSSISRPVASASNLVNAAIELFALIFPQQNVQTQETVMEQIIKAATYSGSRVSANRKAACQINSLVAVIGVLKYVAAKKGQLASPKVSVAIRDLMLGFVKSPNSSVRLAACEIAGRIARINGNSLFINPIIQDFVDKIINNRDPDVRAGSCLALGSIYHFVGGMAAGSHLKTCVEIFHSLATDQHHHVHTWALHALHLTIESAGLMYGPYINSTLSLTAKLFMSESHEPAASSCNLPGIEGNAEIYPTFGRILNALIGVIGPELQDSSKLRDICFTLFEQLKNDDDPLVVVEAIKCIQNFILFSPKYLDIPVIIPFLQKQLIVDNKNQISIVRTAAITCLYQLTQKTPESVLGAVMDNCLEEQLFALLDVETDTAVLDEIKDILLALLKYVGPSNPSRWIDLCKSILSRSGVKDFKASAVAEIKTAIEDDGEEAEPASVTCPSQNQFVKGISVSLLPRWRTQVGNRKEDFDLALAKMKKNESPDSADFLIFRIGDLIKLAFNSSTGSVSYLRLTGLKLLQGIIESYSHVSDPDFAGHRLLEQYEAQIISALAPGFESDATPDITNDACHVTAYYLCSGITQDISINIRPVKLLTNFLDQLVLQDYKSNGRTPNAQLVIKLAVLSSWASIYSKSNSTQRIALFSVSLHKLFSLWFGVLKEYCLLGDDAEQENLMGLTGPNQAKSLYSTATKDVTYTYYKKSWLIIMEAVGNLVEEKASCILELFPDASQLSSEDFDLSDSFFTLMGLCFRELSLPISGARTTADTKKMLICIKCVKQLLSPHVIGKGCFPDELTNELLSVFDKLSQTEDLAIQESVLDTLFHIEISINDPSKGAENELKIFRIILNFFANQIPILSSNPSFSSRKYVSGKLLSRACDFLKKIVETGHFKKEASSLSLILTSVLLSDVRFVDDAAPKILIVLKTCLNLSSIHLPLVLLESLAQSLISNFQSFSLDNSAVGLSVLKNISLAIILCMSARPETFSHSLLSAFSSVIIKLLSSEHNEAKMVAVQASRAMLMISSRAEVEFALIGSVYCRVLLPPMFSNALIIASRLEENEVNVELLEENLKTLLLISMAQSKERYKFLNFLLTVNMYLEIWTHLKSGTKSAIRLQHFIGTTLVQLASQKACFKAVVQELESSKKVLLENIMKQTLQTHSSASFTVSLSPQNVEEAPKIKLKMFG